MLLESILKSVAEKLLIDFRYVSSEIQLRPSKGQVREAEIVEGFLRQCMPRSVGIDRGEIVCTEGGRSGECDVVMYGRDSCPILIDKSGYKVFGPRAGPGASGPAARPIRPNPRLDSARNW